MSSRRTVRVVCCFGMVLALGGCASRDWPTHRYNSRRTANQPHITQLADPSHVHGLHELWRWHPGIVGDADQVSVNGWGPKGFSASPIVYKSMVYVGHLNGHLYAISTSGSMVWKYPAVGSLSSQTTCNPSSPGIASSATLARVKVKWFWFLKKSRKVVIFGAPDPNSNGGDGRVWALDAQTGALVWQSPVLASRANNEQIGYDSPVVHRGRVYVGISNHCDDPIIAGKVYALDLQTGALLPALWPFVASATRGGGLWSSPATTADGDVVVTTGNGCTQGDGGCASEPPHNHALSMIRLDGATGGMIWKFQPVPWGLDLDPDWAAVPTVADASCGTMAVAPMKDGYSHAVNIGPHVPAGPPEALGLSLRRWTFPADGSTIPFTSGVHYDWRYIRGAAVWNDVVFAVTGGWDRSTNPTEGYNELHALNACTPDSLRVRWWLWFPGTGDLNKDAPTMGAPSVTGGIVYVGTSTDTLYAIADTTVAPATGQHCEVQSWSLATCTANGKRPTPIPQVLARVGLSGPIRTTPALARGHVYVTTDAGYLHVLAP